MCNRLSETELLLTHREGPLILIVEDEMLILHLIESTLEEGGFKVPLLRLANEPSRCSTLKTRLSERLLPT